VNCDKFQDLRNAGDDKIAFHIKSLNIDILIDLAGYMDGAREFIIAGLMLSHLSDRSHVNLSFIQSQISSDTNQCSVLYRPTRSKWTHR